MQSFYVSMTSLGVENLKIIRMKLFYGKESTAKGWSKITLKNFTLARISIVK